MNQSELILYAAELALASYANLLRGDTEADENKQPLTDAGLVPDQATAFAARVPTIITQFNDTPAEGGIGTSFSVTVFKDTVGSAAGNITIAFRGTGFPPLSRTHLAS